MTDMDKDLVTPEKKYIDPRDYEPAKRNYATPADKRALGVGALLFAGAAAGFVFLTGTGKALRNALRPRR